MVSGIWRLCDIGFCGNEVYMQDEFIPSEVYGFDFAVCKSCLDKIEIKIVKKESGESLLSEEFIKEKQSYAKDFYEE